MSEPSAAALAKWSAKLDKREAALNKLQTLQGKWYMTMRDHILMRDTVSRAHIRRARVALQRRSDEMDEMRAALKRQSVQMQKAYRQKRAIRRAALK